MNNRLKFRVWSKTRQQYIEKDSPRCYLNYDGELDCCYLTDTKDVECIYEPYPEDDLIYEQCTGLRDKNGKLIYEGDIVNIFCCRHPYGYLGRTKGNVYWSNPDAEFRIKVSLEEEYNLYGIEIEVIGNINENPELLEKSDE